MGKQSDRLYEVNGVYYGWFYERQPNGEAKQVRRSTRCTDKRAAEAVVARPDADGSYPGARPLYIYVKMAHLSAVPGLKDYVAAWAKVWGPDGLLKSKGMEPAGS